MNDADCVHFLQEALPRLRLRWPGFSKVRKQACKRVGRRLRELGLTDISAYADYLAAHPEEWQTLDRLCRISISRFYRDRGVFDALRDVVLPNLADAAMRRGDDTIAIWSAGCASGEEPYSLKLLWTMSLVQQFPDLALRIVATDADERLLKRAADGDYPRGCLKELPRAWIAKAFEDRGDDHRLRPNFRSGITFVHQDIRNEVPDGPFDLILCRNLAFTYFDLAVQRSVLESLAGRLRVGGYLVIGKHESLPATTPRFSVFGQRLPIYRRTAQTVPQAA